MDPPGSTGSPNNNTTLDLLEFTELVSIALDTPTEVNRLSDSFSRFECKPPSTPISYHAGSSFTESSHSTPLQRPPTPSLPSPSMPSPVGGSPSSTGEPKAPSRLQSAFKRIKRQASAHFRSIKKKTASASVAFPASLAQTAHRFSTSKSERVSTDKTTPERGFTPYLPWAHQLEQKAREERQQAQAGSSSTSDSLSTSPASIQTTTTAPVPTLAHSSSNHSISTVTEAEHTFPITPVTPSSAFGVLDAVLDKDDELRSHPKLSSRWSRYTDDADSGFQESAAHFPGSDSPSEYSQSGEADESHHHHDSILISDSERPAEENISASGHDAQATCGSQTSSVLDDAGSAFGPFKIHDRCCSPLKPSDPILGGGVAFPGMSLQLSPSPEMSRRVSKVSRTSSRKTTSGQSTGSKKDWTLTLPLNVLFPPSPQRQTSLSLSSGSGSIHGKSSRVLAHLKDEEGYTSDESLEDEEDDNRLGPSPSSWPWPSPPPSPENIDLKKAKRPEILPLVMDASVPSSSSVTPTAETSKQQSKDTESVKADDASVYHSACPGARSSNGSQVAQAHYAAEGSS